MKFLELALLSSAVLLLAPSKVSVAEEAASGKAIADTSSGEAEDTEAADSGESQLGIEQLAWLAGDWVDEGGVANVATSVKWAAKGRFLTRVFAVSDEEGVALEGTQVIGWDAANNQIRSWTFDTEGGFGEAFWTRDGNSWLIKKTFTLSSGERAAALNVITMVDENTFQWQSLNRHRGDELLPNIEPVTIVRKVQSQSDAGNGEEEESK